MKKGFVLPSIIITTVFLSALLVLITSLAVNNFKLAAQDRFRLNAQLAVDAGIDTAVVELNTNNDWTGTGGEVELLNDGDVRTTYEINVSDGDEDDEKIVSAIGRTYRPVTSTSPENQRSYSILLEGISNGGTFSVVTGVGGLYMSNSARVVGGDVFVNGEIRMSNTAQIGSLLFPVNVKAAHQNCPIPADATYPRVCNNGENGQPITIANSAAIYGTVVANNQVDGSGMSMPGLTAGSVAPSALPTHDRDAQKAAVTNTLTGSSASCTNNGTKTWAANTHVTGDVTISKKCEVTINGDVWIDGYLNMDQSGKIIIADSLGTTQPAIMVDGSSGVDMRNSSSIQSNSSGTGAFVLTYYSTAGCSPNCADVTGGDLENSRGIETIKIDNSAAASDSVFFSRWTQLTMSNSGGIGAVVGQTVDLNNTAVITFGSAVPTPGGKAYTYFIKEYKRDFQ